jgi:hypothetical protein
VTGVTGSATLPTGVLLVGLGEIGRTHARALEFAFGSALAAGLEAGPRADVVAGVDVDGSKTLTFLDAERPVYPSRPGPGALLGAESFFADPYYDDFERAAATLGDSWLDSGINALSVLARFATIVKRESLRRIGAERQSVFEAHLACQRDGRPVDALLVTSWHVADPAKTTRLRYASGIELLMDHTAVAAYLLRDGRIEAAFGADRSIPRRDRHYRALYQRWLGAEGGRALPAETSLHLHEVLLGE